jgi:hypothetical protein
MATERYYQQRPAHQLYDPQECARKSSSSSFRRNRSSEVQTLNNRACVLVSIGNFSKANELFEIALAKHKDMACGTPSASQDTTDLPFLCTTSENCTGEEMINVVTMVDVYDDFDYVDHNDYENSESSFVCDDDDRYDDDFLVTSDIGNLIDCDQGHHTKKTSIVSSSISQTSQSPSSCDDDHLQDNLLSIPFPPVGFRRMSNFSQLQTFSYSGQDVDRFPDKWMQHQVYSLPIVMEKYEWDNAPTSDRSFVLIFNSALCNHLMGVQLLLNHQLQKSFYQKEEFAAIDQSAYKGPFEVARMLYKLALEVFSGATSKSESGGLFVGVDRLCYPAVFNNLSHVFKTLEGYNSYDAFQYDQLLLKSVYWLIDSAPSSANSTPHHAAAPLVSQGIEAFATLNGTESPGSQNNSSSSDCYDDDNADVIDAFLENAFYLIGTPRSIAPAPAA